MKKTIFAIAMLFAGIVSGFATDNTARAFITMDASILKLRENPDYTSVPNAACALDANNKGVVASYDSKRWAQLGLTDLGGLNLVFTPTATDVTFTFSYVTGTQLYLVDANDGSYTAIADGETYSFTVESSAVGTAIANRFSISKNAPAVPTTPAICHENGMLKVTGDITAPVQLDGADILTAAGNYDLSTTAPGQHKVTFEGQELIINVR